MKVCSLCSRQVNQLFPLSFELRDVQICPECRAELSRIRQLNEEMPLEEKRASFSKFKEYQQAHWTAVRDPKAKQFLDGIEQKAKSMAPSEEEYREILRQQQEDAEREQELNATAQLRLQQLSRYTTAGEGFEGKRIVRYLGLVSGAATYMMGGLIGEGITNAAQSRQFAAALRFAAGKAQESAMRAGGNGLIGLQHALSSVNGTMIVTVSATAVELEDI